MFSLTILTDLNVGEIGKNRNKSKLFTICLTSRFVKLWQ